MIMHHKTLTLEKWNAFSFVEQMANVGSEIHRTISWREKDSHLSSLAFERALELLDITIADPKNKSKLKELCRLRELAADYFFGQNEYNSDDAFFEKYFYNFNYAARIGR